MKEEFKRELAALINKHNMEVGSNTPDYILADYLCACLVGFNATVNVREEWFGRIHPFATLCTPPTPIIPD